MAVFGYKIAKGNYDLTNKSQIRHQAVVQFTFAGDELGYERGMASSVIFIDDPFSPGEGNV